MGETVTAEPLGGTDIGITIKLVNIRELFQRNKLTANILEITKMMTGTGEEVVRQAHPPNWSGCCLQVVGLNLIRNNLAVED